MNDKRGRGRPPERAVNILELWIDCIENMNEIKASSKFIVSRIRSNLQESEQYKRAPEEYSKAMGHLSEELKKGKEKYGIFIQNDDGLWGLSETVINAIETEKFREERESDSKEAVKYLFNHVRDKTSKDYYVTPHLVPTKIELPVSLETFYFRLTEKIDPRADWFSPGGIGRQEYDKGLYPRKTIHLLKIQIENAWKKRKCVVLFANPAQGKTTSTSILLYKWQLEGSNNVCFRIQSTEWNSRLLQFEELFHKYTETNLNYRFIIVIEDIHLVEGKIDGLGEMSRKHNNVQFLMTSRISTSTKEEMAELESAEIVEIVAFPSKYLQELVWAVLRHHNKISEIDKSKIKSLISKSQRGNIFYTFSEIASVFNIKELSVSWSKQIKNLISAGKKHTEIQDSNYWHRVFLLLSIFRKYELKITENDFYNVCRLYGSKINESTHGETFTFLLDHGYLVGDSSKSHHVNMH